MLRLPRRSTLFPYTRLFRSDHLLITGPDPARERLIRAVVVAAGARPDARREVLAAYGAEAVEATALECSSDRKSTRLDSSHSQNSYAACCLHKHTHCHRSAS